MPTLGRALFALNRALLVASVLLFPSHFCLLTTAGHAPLAQVAKALAENDVDGGIHAGSCHAVSAVPTGDVPVVAVVEVPTMSLAAVAASPGVLPEGTSSDAARPPRFLLHASLLL